MLRSIKQTHYLGEIELIVTQFDADTGRHVGDMWKAWESKSRPFDWDGHGDILRAAIEQYDRGAPLSSATRIGK